MTSTDSTTYPQLIRDVSAGLAPLRAGAPDVMKGFGELSRAAMAEGALTAKTKELIAMALGVAARQCAGRIRRVFSCSRSRGGGQLGRCCLVQ